MEVVELAELAAVIIAALGTAALGMVWVWRQSQRPSREAQQIEVLRAQLADEMARNDKLADRSDRLAARIDALEAEQEAMREAHVADREEAASLRAEVGELRHGIQLLIDQLKKAELTPVWQPPEPRPPRKRPVSGSSLAVRIAAQFDLEEMNSLAFDIEIDPQAFGGTTLEARARELVRVAARRGKTAALEQRIGELRAGTQE